MKKVINMLSVFMLLNFITIPSLQDYGWGISKNDNHQQPEVGFYAEEIASTNSFYIGDTTKPYLYLTFDAGYDNGCLEKIVQTLKEKEAPATFFVTGDFIEREPEKIKMIVQSGNIIGNHTYSHKSINKISEDKLKTELEQVEVLYQELIGEEMLKMFRPPEGEFDHNSLMRVKNLGYSTFFWSLAYKDWDTKNQKGIDFAYSSIMDNLHNGAIILLHTVSVDNANVLGKVIDDARSLGYQFRSLEDFTDSSVN